jgi:hypothetical protein
MIIYAGPFSTINLVAESSLLVVSWTDNSKTLDEKSVKFEIGRILDYIKEYKIINVIVDTRNYYFLDNITIQNWINQTYMPLIMDSGVMKYGLVTKSAVKDKYVEFGEVDPESMQVEYFTDVENARKWIES